MDQILNVLSYVFWVAIALGILVLVHELGHFLTARLFGMRVDAFSIGFPPVIARKKIGQTEYRLGAVPLGGYVKIAGMVDESLDTTGEQQPKLDPDGNPVLDEKGKPVYVSSEPEPDEFRAKPVWQRIVVITGGVVFNLILAGLIFIGLALAYGEAYLPAANVPSVWVRDSSIAYEMGLRTGDRIVALNGEELVRFDELESPTALASDPYELTVERDGERLTFEGPDQLMTRLNRTQANSLLEGMGIGYDPAIIGGVATGMPAERAGLRAGDRIINIDGRPVVFWQEMTGVLLASGGRPLRVQWARPIADVAADDPAPRATNERWAYYQESITPSESDGAYRLGVVADPEALGYRFRDYSFTEGVAAGVTMAVDRTAFYVHTIGRLVTGKENLRESVGGPLMIAKQSKEAADRGPGTFWSMVAMLSIALAVFNIFPIPALDGGHLVFLLYEGLTRREPSLKVRIAAQQVGMVVLLLFMAFVIFNDALRWIG